MAETTTPKVVNYLTPSIFLHQEPKDEKQARDTVEFTLKVKAGSNAKAQTYKKKVQRFHSGTATDWIDVLENLEEIWSQNSITSPSDREANVRALFRDDSLTAFEAFIEDARRPNEGNNALQPLTNDMIEAALDAVAKENFPHRALENQKLWMRRSIRKPKDMSTRKMTAALVRMNTKLIRFPGATERDLFSAEDLLEIIEWSLPPKWRAKFDLSGYVPSLFNRARLIAECEAIERSEASVAPSSNSKNHKKEHESKHKTKKGNGNGTAKSDRQFYFSEHGKNSIHTTTGCFTLKKRAKLAAESSSAPKTFSNDKFREDINLMSKGKSKKKILDLYAAVIKKERSQLKTRASKKQKKKALTLEVSSDEDSSGDDDMEVNTLEPTKELMTAAMKSDLKTAVAKNLRELAITNTKIHALALKANIDMKADLAKAVLLNPNKRDIEQANASDEEQAFQASIETLGQAKKSKSREESSALELEEESSEPSSEEEEPMKE
jgi:hypothetical protein